MGLGFSCTGVRGSVEFSSIHLLAMQALPQKEWRKKGSTLGRVGENADPKSALKPDAGVEPWLPAHSKPKTLKPVL